MKKLMPPCLILLVCLGVGWNCQAQVKGPFAPQFPKLESRATGQWWTRGPTKRQPMELDVPRDEVVAFALYTHDHGLLKLTAQLFPLKPGEAREVSLEFQQADGSWKEVARQPVQELGWSAHFRMDDWDNSKDVPYRVRHGDQAKFEGLIRKDPVDKEVIVVGNLSCNSSRTPRSAATHYREPQKTGSRPVVFCRRPVVPPYRAHLRLAGVGDAVPRPDRQSTGGHDSR